MQFNSSIKIYLISYFDVDINCHVGHFQGTFNSETVYWEKEKNKEMGLSVFLPNPAIEIPDQSR